MPPKIGARHHGAQGLPRLRRGAADDDRRMESTTLADVQGALGAVAGSGQARAAVRRAAKIVGVDADQPLERRELIRVCSALAAEGGTIQQLAEEIAGEALRS